MYRQEVEQRNLPGESRAGLALTGDGSRDEAPPLQNVELSNKERQFYDKVADHHFPLEESCIVMSNGKFQVTMKGSSTCLIAKYQEPSH